MSVNGLIFTDCVSQQMLWQRSAGAYRIATEVRRMGWSVQVIDFWSFLIGENNTLLLDMLLTKFVGPDTKFVAFSTTFLSKSFQTYYGLQDYGGKSFVQQHRSGNVLEADLGLLRAMRERIKAINPNTDIILAGSRAVIPDDGISDIRMTGYGEMHMADYFKWKTGKAPLFVVPQDRRGRKLYKHNTKADGFDFANSVIEWAPEDCVMTGETLPIEVSRGCIFSCSFCSYPLNGKRKLDYLKDTEVLRQEMVRNYEEFGVTNYILSDDTFNDTTFKVKWFTELSESLPFRLRFSTYVRLDLLAAHPEQIEMLHRAGAASVFFGIESLNHQSAKAIGKGAHPDKLKATLQRCRDLWKTDVVTQAGFIVGLPYETEQTVTDWISEVMSFDFPLHGFELNPLGIKNPSVQYPYAFWSELDRTQEQYGYRWDDRGQWFNTDTGMTYERANQITAEVMTYADSISRIASPAFAMSSMMAYGATTREAVAHGRWGAFHNTRVPNKAYAAFQQYISKVLSL